MKCRPFDSPSGERWHFANVIQIKFLFWVSKWSKRLSRGYRTLCSNKPVKCNMPIDASTLFYRTIQNCRLLKMTLFIRKFDSLIIASVIFSLNISQWYFLRFFPESRSKLRTHLTGSLAECLVYMHKIISSLFGKHVLLTSFIDVINFYANLSFITSLTCDMIKLFMLRR